MVKSNIWIAQRQLITQEMWDKRRKIEDMNYCKRLMNYCNDLLSPVKEIRDKTLRYLELEKAFGNKTLIADLEKAFKILKPEQYQKILMIRQQKQQKKQ